MALPLQLQDHAVFDSFWPAGNEPVVAFLADVASDARGPGGFVWGATATGKTHLLQAVCARAGGGVVYLPLRTFRDGGPAILEGVASRGFVCLDDIDVVAGNEGWETALFELLNALHDSGGVVIAAAGSSPRKCGFALADLESRFAQLPVFQLAPLPEAERLRALQLRARHRGLDLPDETANYLLSRSRRDMASLYRLLDRLDAEALKAKRRLTIPFVREVIRP